MNEVNLLTALFTVLTDALAGPYMLAIVIMFLGILTVTPAAIVAGAGIAAIVVIVAVLVVHPKDA